jgi:putative transcriptional regulator
MLGKILRGNKLTVVNRVREFREARAVTQQDLAAAAGVSRQSIISIEKGHYLPSLALALKLARIFECTTDELFELKEV